MKSRTGAYGRVVRRERLFRSELRGALIRLPALAGPVVLLFVNTTVAVFAALFLGMTAERVQILVGWWRETH